ncbi:MAG: HlyC/CorC family transporter [Phycisphaerae bacterium]|jgi:putative hemolysin|nr:HlyC/CorC family transporter [Phycisphaerae bacterium]
MIDEPLYSSWSGVDVALLISLLPLLVLSAFFSCSETAFFRITQAQSIELQQRKTPPANAALRLIKQRRTVLITILIGNMTANVFFFVVSSVIMLRAPGGVTTEIGIALATLFSIVIFGEVLPKMAATARPVGIATLLAPPLLLLHHFISPLRRFIDWIIITPLSRLATSDPSPPLDANELAALVALSTSDGIIDLDEQQILHDVVALNHIRVREVMMPRVRMVAVGASTQESGIRDVIEKSKLTQLPVYGEDLDEIIGMLHTKRYLQRTTEGTTLLQTCMTKPMFIPQVATLDQLLNHFRETKTRLAIVVDEFGGTAGIVTLEDVLEELIGEIGDATQRNVDPPKQLTTGEWLLDADTGVRSWFSATGPLVERFPAATMGGLVAAKLGRIPELGDTIVLANIQLKVASMDAYRVATVIVSVQDGAS